MCILSMYMDVFICLFIYLLYVYIYIYMVHVGECMGEWMDGTHGQADRRMEQQTMTVLARVASTAMHHKRPQGDPFLES